MGNLNVAVIGAKGLAGEVGKKGTVTDMTFYDYKSGTDSFTLIEPSKYPEKLSSLFYSVAMSEFAILVVDSIDSFLGETIVIASSLMQYIACSPDYSMSGTMNDEGEGMGLYLYDNGTRAYLCPGDDGNSFTLSAERFGRYGDDQLFDGVFYRNADFDAYTDMENAEFYEDEYSTFYIWYYDGVNRYLLGNDYTIGDDGLAYHDEDGLVYPAGWIPEAPYDPADDWGENWMDNWDI